jgi:hypothetical protein
VTCKLYNVFIISVPNGLLRYVRVVVHNVDLGPFTSIMSRRIFSVIDIIMNGQLLVTAELTAYSEHYSRSLLILTSRSYNLKISANFLQSTRRTSYDTFLAESFVAATVVEGLNGIHGRIN